MSEQHDKQACELRDALYDAFMALWRGGEHEQAALWAAYLAAQARYESYLIATD